MRSCTFPLAVLILILNDDDCSGAIGVDALVTPPTALRHQNLLPLDSVRRHSYPSQHQSLQERYSSFSPSSDWYTDASTRPAPVSIQQQERQPNPPDVHEPSPNEVLWMRQATIEDIPSLQKCNRALLPENYPDRFYENYLKQFPDLTVIVESFSVEESSVDHEYNGWCDDPPSSTLSLSPARPVPVAYAMGCIRKLSEPAKQQQQWQYLNKRSSSEERYHNLVHRPLVLSGHTISLAVMPTHRKMGLATKLLDYLHDSMRHRYGAVACDLSVRMSNERAIRLYENHGYTVSERLCEYYKNGKLEDGLKMQKGFSSSSSSSSSSESRITLPQQMFVY
ncbi:MAG: hypothetical protein SGBAC_005003 [Bacillariaceae sp.]